MGFTLSRHGCVSLPLAISFPFQNVYLCSHTCTQRETDRENWCHPAAKFLIFFFENFRHKSAKIIWKMFSARCHCPDLPSGIILGKFFLYAQLKNLFFFFWGSLVFWIIFFLVFREFVWVSWSCFFFLATCFLFSFFFVLFFSFFFKVLHVV